MGESSGPAAALSHAQQPHTPPHCPRLKSFPHPSPKLFCPCPFYSCIYLFYLFIVVKKRHWVLAPSISHLARKGGTYQAGQCDPCVFFAPLRVGWEENEFPFGVVFSFLLFLFFNLGSGGVRSTSKRRTR